MTSKTTYPAIGTVSHGTMRPEDLIPCFHAVLFDLSPDKSTRAYLDDIMRRRRTVDDYYDSDECHYDLEWLFDTLDEFAPPYCYFGSHPGNDSDYGFWPYI